MRIWNEKLRRPRPEDEFEYTEEELAEIGRTKKLLQSAERNLRVANQAWLALVRQTSAFLLPPLQVVSKIAQVRHNRYEHRKMRREAYINYLLAVVPERLRNKRAGKLISGYVKERLSQPSFAERILPVEKS